ncbi:Tsi3 family protein [Sphingomonas sp.]|uniref:Tsi3 family protein n=1 Tax=Sphingomonas sp. TaxID=28214 RepID=UPI003B3A1BBC
MTAQLGETTITLNVPVTFVVSEAAGGGIRLTQPDADRRRRASEVEITVGGGGTPLLLPLMRGIGAAHIQYGVTRAEGGSGGAEVRLVAQRRCGGDAVRLTLDEQLEPFEPSEVDSMLEMLATAQCRAPGNKHP